VVPYIDPKKLANQQAYSLNEKSDVYSIGVLSWEISSGKPPFYSESVPYDISLAIQIVHGYRETIVSGTPVDYSNLYTGKYNL
jgi:serine/threonine protein kinase